MTNQVDAALIPGAHNAIAVCMNVGPQDRVWILTDAERAPIGEALAAAAREQHAEVALRYMERSGTRPLHLFPDTMRADLLAFDPTVTLLATTAQPGEIRFRLPFARFLRQEMWVRHGHMIGVTPALMSSGMMADYHRVAALTFAVRDHMQQAQEVHVTSELGTDLTVRLDNERFRWIPFHGLYHRPGQWGNLPEGETCTTPLDVNGVLYAELLGDYFCARYGVLDSPLVMEITEGWVSGVYHQEDDLAQEVWSYLDQAPNGRRVGEFAVGTNEALHSLSGNLLQDEKYPGVHVAFGNPVPEVTGAPWSSDIHVDAITTRCTILLDGKPIMKGGTFLI